MCNRHSCRRQRNVDETVDALRSKGLEVKGMVCHVGNTEHRKALIQRAVQVQHSCLVPYVSDQLALWSSLPSLYSSVCCPAALVLAGRESQFGFVFWLGLANQLIYH